MVMNRQKQIEQFAKLAATILGRCPHEFGLVPDPDGFIKTKEFIQAVTETDGWRHVRLSHINDMMLMIGDPPVEEDQNRLRAKDRGLLPVQKSCENPPNLLYLCIKQKSYPAVLKDGILPTFFDSIVCCEDKAMAERIGKRRDQHPVLLTVHVSIMKKKGLPINQFGDGIYLTDFIPSDCFTGPPLSKDIHASKRAEKKPESVETYKRQTQAGTFPLKPPGSDSPVESRHKGKHKEKDSSWKHNKKRLRKEKTRDWQDF